MKIKPTPYLLRLLTKACPALLFAATVQVAGAQTVIQTSFETTETPAFAAANVHNQNGWTVTAGAAAVYTAKAHTGTQALNMTAAGVVPDVNKVSYTGSQAGLTGEVYADLWLNIQSVSGSGSGFIVNGYDLYASSSKRLFAIDFRGDNKIYVNSASASNIGTWTANTWFRLSVKLDINAEKYKVALNGVVMTNPATATTDFPLRETYTPTASGTRPAGKEYHSLKFNTGSALTVDATVDDLYVGSTAIPGISFGSSAVTRTITITQPAYGSIALNPATGPYTVGQSVTATLTLPAGYKNNGWTGDLSGTTLVQHFTVNSNMAFGADVGIDYTNPPAQYTVTVNQPANGTITLSPAATNNTYYSETIVTATISSSACYQLTGWTGDLSGTTTTQSFNVNGPRTIGANLSLNTTPASVRVANSVAAFKSALAAMNPGDTVILENGSYALGGVTINRSGCAARPIVIMARNTGGATFTGGGTILMESLSYVTFKGFNIKTSDPGTGIKMQNCSYVRIAENTFNITETTSCNWLYIGDTYGSPDSLKSGHNVVDHNLFMGKTAPGKFIVFDGNIDQQSRYDTVRYNHFKNNGPRVDNEKESIRIGVTTLTRSNGFTVVERNLFEDCDGDPEIVSIKSCNNTVRYNTFRRCLGTVCIRQSSNSTVEGNFFFGEGKTAQFTNSNGNTSTIGCGGVRVYGLNHRIINNYFSGLTGSRFDAALVLNNGDDHNYPGANNSHHQPENVVVAFNTFVNNTANIEVGFDNSGNYTRPPINCAIANNLIAENLNPILKFYSTTSRNGVTLSNNLLYATGTGTIGATVNASEATVADPLLVQPACGNPGPANCTQSNAYKVYRLSAASPAINAATGTYPYLLTDNEGQPRGAQKDIGADEYLAENNTVYTGPLDSNQVGMGATDYTYTYSFNSSLPVELRSFTGAYHNSAARLDWEVAAEAHLKNYVVEWSVNGRDFTAVATVAANGAPGYTAHHNGAVPGRNYYRLKLTDTDGHFRYSAVVLLNTSKLYQVVVYPNPAKSFIQVSLQGGDIRNAALAVYDLSGKALLNTKVTGNNMQVNLPAHAAGAHYLVIRQTGTILFTQTFMAE